MKIFLTELGVEKRKLVKNILINFNQKLLKVIPKKDMEVFFRVLATINDLACEENPANKNNTVNKDTIN